MITHPISQLLARPIAFHRCFVDITGTINGAVMLSQALYWQIRNEGGWWFQNQEKWTAETGLTRTEQETVRRALRNKSFWKEELRGLPAKMYYFVDIQALADLIIPRPSLQEPCIQACGSPAYRHAGNLHTTIQETKEETKEETTPTPSGNGRIPSRPRNELLDLIVGIDGSDPTKATRTAFSNAQKILREIKEVEPNVTVSEINRRAANYRAKYQGAALTPNALAKHWGSLDATPTPSAQSGRNLGQMVRFLEDQIANHQANPEFRGYLPELTSAKLNAELDALKRRLYALRKSMALDADGTGGDL